MNEEPGSFTDRRALESKGPRATVSRPLLTFPLAAPAASALATGSGALFWLAFPTMDNSALAAITWVPLVLALHRQSAFRSTLLGWLAGSMSAFLGFFWVPETLRTFSGFPAALCFVFAALLAFYQGGRGALFGWLVGRATARGWPLLPVFCGAFVASELVYPLLFPWYFAATVHRWPVLLQVAELGGPIAVGLCLVVVNVGLAETALAWLEQRPVRWAAPLVGVATVLATLLYGSLRIAAVEQQITHGESVTVGVVQANMGLVEKRSDFLEGERRHLDASTALLEQKVDFLVWSESSLMRPVRQSSYARELSSLTQRIGAPAIFGGVVVREVPDERGYVLHNSAFSSDASGTITGRYDKQYLLAFGEYLPFGEMFPALYRWSPKSGRFTPGTSFDPVMLHIRGKQHPVTVLICYEDVVPEMTNRAVAQANPELLVDITNDAWFGDSAEPWQHLALAKLRAIEHRRFLVRGANSGVSAVVDPVGRVIAQSGTFTRETLIAPIRFMRANTLYEQLGRWPWLLVSIIVAAAAFFHNGRSSATKTERMARQKG